MLDFLAFGCRLGLRWSPTSHRSFVVVEIPLPLEPAMTNIAGERFRPAAARVAPQVIASSEPSAARGTYIAASVLVQVLS